MAHQSSSNIGFAKQAAATRPSGTEKSEIIGHEPGVGSLHSGTIPVVMSFGTGDLVAAGFATSITRPGGNITGVVTLAPELNAKRLTLLHEAMPKARRPARHRLLD
jgi:hypothetical protein